MAYKEETQHALLIPWGRFAHAIGLVSAIEAVALHQNTYVHTPQRKALEFFVWATVWISQNVEQDEHTLHLQQMGIKKQVQVAANTSAIVIQNSDGMLLRFSNASVFAGKELFFRNPQRPTPRSVFLRFLRFRY